MKIAVVVSVVIALAFPIGAWRSTASNSLGLEGVGISVPEAWDSEAFVNRSGMLVFRIGSYDFRHAPDDDVGMVAQGSMGANDVLIDIVDVTATDPSGGNRYYRAAALPLTVKASEATGQEGYKSPAAVIRGVRVNGHNLWLSVAFGRARPTDAQVAAANAALRTLTVS
jgi:hypothetical protein